MTKFLMLALIAFAGSAHAESLSGDQAKTKWDEIVNAATTTDNTVCETTIQFKNVSCTLKGSHASCGQAEEYTCEISN